MAKIFYNWFLIITLLNGNVVLFILQHLSRIYQEPNSLNNVILPQDMPHNIFVNSKLKAFVNVYGLIRGGSGAHLHCSSNLH